LSDQDIYLKALVVAKAVDVIDLSEYEQSGRWRVVREGPLEQPALERLLG
jgi:hypothetical protein